jgi:hypothetical protein
MPSKDKLNVAVENFGLSAAANARVQTALHQALTKELSAVGHAAADGVFGDGSVKGKTAIGTQQGNAERT